MRVADFHRFFRHSALVAGVTVATMSLPHSAAAQTPTPNPAASPQTNMGDQGDMREDGQDWGWLGLLGLAGLLGLRRRDPDRVDTRSRP